MGNSFIIEIYKDKNAEDFTSSLATPYCRMQGTSAAASTGAYAAALGKRVVEKLSLDGVNDDRIEYMKTNMEIIRKYMVHLIDEDIHCRGPLRRALKEGGEREIEAGLQASTSISTEIIGMMGNFMDLLYETVGYVQENVHVMHQVKQSAIFALAAARAAQEENVAASYRSIDDTFSFILKREDELMLEKLTAKYDAIQAVVL